MNLSHLPNWVVPKLKNAILEFIWNGKKHKIKYNVLISSVKFGGLGLLDIERMKCALRLKFVKKYFDVEHPLNPISKALISYNLDVYKNMKLGVDVFRINLSYNGISKLPLYYSEMLRAWKRLTGDRLVGPQCADELRRQPLFDNPLIMNSSGNTLYYKYLIDCGINKMSDVIYEYIPGFQPVERIAESLVTNVKGDILIKTLNNIIKSIPAKWQTIIKNKALGDFMVPGSLHFFVSKGDEATLDISTTSTRFFNHHFRKIDELPVIPAGLAYWRDQFSDAQLKIPFEICYGGLKENFMGEIDFFLVHNTLYTNDRLCRMDDDTCSLCDTVRDSVTHLFIDCSFVQDLLVFTRDICQTIINKLIPFDEFVRYVILGFTSSKSAYQVKLINFILNIYRYTIWSVRKWKKAGKNVSVRHVFRSFISTRMKWEYRRSIMYNHDDTSFFNSFGLNQAIVRPIDDGYELSFV
jgi:hypothetical protein